MYKLINTFFYELDDILIKNNDIKNHEILVYRINTFLFDFDLLYNLYLSYLSYTYF